MPYRAWRACPAQQWETAHPAGRRRGAGGPLPQAPPDSQRLYGGCFTDAEEALDAFLASPTRWQLALVDGTMPKYKGTALIQRMRSENPNLAPF